MIKECNFKQDSKEIVTEFGTLKYPYKYRCDLSSGKCLGEKNCVLFQIYANNSIVVNKEIADANFNKIMERYGPAKYEVFIDKVEDEELNDDDCDAIDLELGIGKYKKWVGPLD